MSSLLVTLACPATASSRRSSSSGRITWIFFRPVPVSPEDNSVPSGIHFSPSAWSADVSLSPSILVTWAAGERTDFVERLLAEPPVGSVRQRGARSVQLRLHRFAEQADGGDANDGNECRQ